MNIGIEKKQKVENFLLFYLVPIYFFVICYETFTLSHK